MPQIADHYQRSIRPVQLSAKRVERVTERDRAHAGTLANAFQVWIASEAWRRLAARAYEGYRVSFRAALSDTKLPGAPTTADVEDWMVRMHHGRGLAATTVNCYKRQIEAVLLVVARRTHDHTLHDAFASASKLPEPPRTRRSPPADALVRAEAACRSDMERLFVRLACCAALRVSEVLGLRDDDLSADGVLTVERQRHRDRRKNRRTHRVLLDRVTAALFRSVRDGKHREVDGRNAHLRCWLFPHSKPWAAALMERIRASLGDEAELYFPRRTAWHAFRHLAATTVGRRAGATAFDVQRVIGDASPGMAGTYMAEVRGETEATAFDVARVLDAAGQLEVRGLEARGSVRAMYGGGGPGGGREVASASAGASTPTEAEAVMSPSVLESDSSGTKTTKQRGQHA